MTQIWPVATVCPISETACLHPQKWHDIKTKKVLLAQQANLFENAVPPLILCVLSNFVRYVSAYGMLVGVD